MGRTSGVVGWPRQGLSLRLPGLAFAACSRVDADLPAAAIQGIPDQEQVVPIHFKQTVNPHFARGQHFTYALTDVGRYYRDYVELMAHWDKMLPGKVHRVIYEELCRGQGVERHGGRVDQVESVRQHRHVGRRQHDLLGVGAEVPV